MPELLWQWVGRKPIEEILALQERLLNEKLNGRQENFLILCEHEEVYTYNHDYEREKFFDAEKIVGLGIPMLQVPGRGGAAMYHGPGQIVVYIIWNIADLKLSGGPLAINSIIENAAKRLLMDLGITAYSLQELVALTVDPLIGELRGQGALATHQNAHGLWVIGAQDARPRKIVSRGLHLGRSITTFGFTLNVSTDLSKFAFVKPCGLDIKMTSIANELGGAPSVKEIADDIAVALARSSDQSCHQSTIYSSSQR